MRASRNLAGVEFSQPPYHLGVHRVETWRDIITGSGYFFAKSSMRFFQSRVNWDSLTQITADTFGFITSERYEQDPRRYTVRGWNDWLGVLDLSDFQQFATLKEARRYLRTDGFRAHLNRELTRA